MSFTVVRAPDYPCHMATVAISSLERGAHPGLLQSFTDYQREQFAVHEVHRLAAEIKQVAKPIAHWGGELPYDSVALMVYRLLVPDELREERDRIRRQTLKRKPISASLRRRVHERDHYRCVECGTHLNLQVDHVVPVAAGGTNDFDNLQTLCRTCNIRKGAKTA